MWKIKGKKQPDNQEREKKEKRKAASRAEGKPHNGYILSKPHDGFARMKKGRRKANHTMDF